MTHAQKVNMILEVAEELRIKEDFDSLMNRGFGYIKEDWSQEESREVLRANL